MKISPSLIKFYTSFPWNSVRIGINKQTQREELHRRNEKLTDVQSDFVVNDSISNNLSLLIMQLKY